MASGIEMLLKATGIDPNEIKASINTFMETVQVKAQEIADNQKRLEGKDDMILAQGKVILERLDLLVANQAGLLADNHSPSTKLLAMDGKDSGAIVSHEKFPQEVIHAVNEGGSASDKDIPTISETLKKPE